MTTRAAAASAGADKRAPFFATLLLRGAADDGERVQIRVILLAGLCGIGAFEIFLVIYAPIRTRSRVRWKAELIMDDLAIVRVLHVLGVVIWIGGVGMVTAVVLPAEYASVEERMRVFEVVESRFAWIARAMTLLVGFSGLYMVWKLDLWDRFSDLSYWWMHAMVCVWALFTFLLFVAEPLFLHRRFAQRARNAPEGTFRLAQRLHWILLLASLITIAGAVAGAHGYVLF